MPLRVLFRISAKKALFLTSAKTVDEVEEIKRPSVPHFEEKGLIVTKKYHIPDKGRTNSAKNLVQYSSRRNSAYQGICTDTVRAGKSGGEEQKM